MPNQVGIMSMHRIRNYGSSLQAYGLKRLIERVDASAEVGFVDYQPGEDVNSASRPSILDQVRQKWSTLQDVRALDGSTTDKLKYTFHRQTYLRRYLPVVGIPAERTYDTNLDVLVIGSDEVFNFTQSTHDVGYVPALFGHTSRANRLCSYAGSFGNTTLARVADSGKESEIRDGLQGFDAISVRDANSADIVEHLVGTRPPIHVDPVLAYDYVRLESRIPTGRLLDEDYILVYGYPGRLNDAENHEVAAEAKRRGARVVCIGGIQACCDTYVDCDPFELIAYFRDAAAVVTDTYHGTILSIINERPFATLVRPSDGGGYGNEEKLGFLLDDLGLGDQRVEPSAAIADVLDHPIDYASVSDRLDRERARTAAYLSAALDTDQT